MWNRRLREMARAAEIYACPYCPERKIFHEESRLFDHVHAAHSDRIPGPDADISPEEFRDKIRAQAREKGYVEIPGMHTWLCLTASFSVHMGKLRPLFSLPLTW